MSHSPAIPIPIVTAWSRAAPACCRPITTSRCASIIFSPIAPDGARMRRWARPWSSSSMIDRVAAKLGRKVYEVPVGFKWFVDGLAARIARLWRRGERGRFLPLPRWFAVDHR
jgi:hypothetical protein